MPIPNEPKACRWGDNGFCPTIQQCYVGGCRGPRGEHGISMSAARLELIEQQMAEGFCWHSHAQELLAEVHRLRHLEFHLKGMVEKGFE